MPSYELTYVLRASDDANLTAVNERIASQIASAGGEIVGRNDWGRRRLAYPIRKNTEGFYVSLQINLPAQAVRGLERALQLTDDVLRYLVIRVDEVPAPAAPEPPAASAASTAPAATAAPAASAAHEPAPAQRSGPNG